MRTNRSYVLVLPFAAIAVVDFAYAHNGGRDDLCCHNDRTEDEYHCHEGPLDGKTFSSKEEAEEYLEDLKERALGPRSSGIRDLYPHWLDANSDGQDTRQEVLIEESLTRVTFLDDSRTKVATGRWWDPYTGKTFIHACMLQIDHVIPIGEVHVSGGESWSEDKRRWYANDLAEPDTLIAVSASANMAKGDKDPAQWLPPNEDYHCEYLRIWRLQKKHWGLEMDANEEETVKSRLEECR